jgi:IS30 family transposase
VGRPRTPRQAERAFWRLIGRGWATKRAAGEVGVSAATGAKWFTEAGGMAPLSVAEPSGRYLSLAEREHLDVRWEDGVTAAEIARELGRHRSTISRELDRNRLRAAHRPVGVDGRRHRVGPRREARDQAGRPRYRAAAAQAKAELRARRPKPAKLAQDRRLRDWVADRLKNQQWSPEQIARRLRLEFPDDERMRISHEAIYQALYVQGRGGLRRELATCLRTGRALRRPRRRADGRRERIKDKVMISERPAEADDRAVPGHWEGDLILGQDGRSAVGTLVERTTRFVLLLHLPADHGAEAVRDAIIAQINTLPEALRRTLSHSH